MVRHAPLAPLGQFPITLPHRARITLRGDSNTAGNRLSDRKQAYAHLLAQIARAKPVVSIEARGGDTAVSGARRWRGSDCGDLVVLMYGSNDAAPRGFLARRQPVPLDGFREALSSQIARCRTGGARVLVLAALPAGSTAMERRLAPYRLAAREAAQSQGAWFLDPVEAFAKAGQSEALLNHDALHLNARGHAELAVWLARQFTVEPGH